MFKKIDKNEVRKAKHSRIRHTLKGTADMPRLNVYRSTNEIYAQIIDDKAGKTLCSASSKDKALAKAVEGKEFAKVDESLPRSCPVCGARMVKNFVSVKEQIQIDECYSCGGKFLDHGELFKIRAQYATEAERSADFMAKVYGTVGVSIKRLEEENAKLRANRSPLKKLFDSVVLG